MVVRHRRVVSDLFKAIAGLCAAIVAVVGLINVLNGQPAGSHPAATATARVVEAGTCLQGFVWREAFAGDKVCVTTDERARVAADNAAAPSRVDPNGPYGPDTCVQGFVWRGARSSDHVCVTNEEHDRVAADNAAAASRVQQ